MLYEVITMIHLRRETNAFADFNNRELLDLSNECCFGFVRYNDQNPVEKVIVVVNFSAVPQYLDLQELALSARMDPAGLQDLWTDRPPVVMADNLVLGGFQFYWLARR